MSQPLCEIVLDTETTGLDPEQGHKVVEIGAIELIDHLPSGREFHVYINPQRDMPAEAEAIHGLSAEFLRDQPPFAGIADRFLHFIGGASLVIHNAAFDLKFLNAELTDCGHPRLSNQVTDTLALARRKFPVGPNNLDALCKRYGIDVSIREKHGALLDAKLLSKVYLELLGGRQKTLSFVRKQAGKEGESPDISTLSRSRPLPARLTEAERQAHESFIASLGKKALWRRYQQNL